MDDATTTSANPYQAPAESEDLANSADNRLVSSVAVAIFNGLLGLLFIYFWIVAFFPHYRPGGNAPSWLWGVLLSMLGCAVVHEIVCLRRRRRRTLVVYRILHLSLAALWILGIQLRLTNQPSQHIAVLFAGAWMANNMASLIVLLRHHFARSE